MHTVLNMDLPAGSWSLVAKGIFEGDIGEGPNVTCDLVHGAAVLDRTSIYDDGLDNARIPFSLVTMVTLPAPGAVRLDCRAPVDSDGQEVGDTKILATAVASF
jgi:hypothetical protein